MEITRFKLTIAYDGANYAGWQAQKTGIGVQQKVEEALQRLFPSVARIHSSSRTDTGVHAIGMVAHVDIAREELRMDERKVALAINAHLPADIRVVEARVVPETFHARFNASGKQYRYFVWNAPAMNPLHRHSAWHVPQPLDLASMRQACKLFVGKHDFRSFAANRNYVTEQTVRTVGKCLVKRQGALLTFIIEGDGFLYKMCRGIVGTLIQVGQGKLPEQGIAEMLEKRDRRASGMNAPAHGLVLWKVFYRKD